MEVQQHYPFKLMNTINTQGSEWANTLECLSIYYIQIHF